MNFFQDFYIIELNSISIFIFKLQTLKLISNYLTMWIVKNLKLLNKKGSGIGWGGVCDRVTFYRDIFGALNCESFWRMVSSIFHSRKKTQTFLNFGLKTTLALLPWFLHMQLLILFLQFPISLSSPKRYRRSIVSMGGSMVKHFHVVLINEFKTNGLL